jgi:competence protein ComEA
MKIDRFLDTEEVNEEQETKKWPGILKDNLPQIILAGLGVILLGTGFFLFGGLRGGEEEVEIETEEEEKGEVMADVGGAVESPGVYKLAEGARINDFLIVAGGVSAEADREFLARYVNLAQKVKDGAKIYILKKSDNGVMPKEALKTEGIVAGAAASNAGAVNVNTASSAELEKLWGIGEATAQKIIEGRPYASAEELLEKKILKKNVYEENKDKLVVY